MLTPLFIGERIRESSVFTLGFPRYGRAFVARSVSYVTAKGPASVPGPPCLVVLPSHVAFNICHGTFLAELRVQRAGANGVVYMKYGGRSDDGEQPPRRRPPTPTRRRGGGASGGIITSVTSLGLVVGMNHTQKLSPNRKELRPRSPSKVMKYWFRK